MKSEVKGSIELLLKSIIVSLLLSMFSNSKVRTFFHFFVWFLSLMVLPDWLRNSDASWGKKLFSTIFVGVISMAILKYFYGIGRVLYSYALVFCVAMISFVVVNYIKTLKAS